MSNIITTCERHGIVNREPTPMSITYMGKYQPGQMRYCPYCGKPTTIKWPKEDTTSWTHDASMSETNLPPWEE